MMSQEEYEEALRQKYPLPTLELKLQQIEKLGYTVVMSDYQCLIFYHDRLIIDADFYEDWHSNAASAVDAFFDTKYHKPQ